MKERIRELAIQSGLPTALDYHQKRYEKFAELIVQEMCSVLDKAQWDKGEDWICADGTRIIPQIKEHFGVE
jgi:hypothetical protein